MSTARDPRIAEFEAWLDELAGTKPMLEAIEAVRASLRKLQPGDREILLLVAIRGALESRLSPGRMAQLRDSVASIDVSARC